VAVVVTAVLPRRSLLAWVAVAVVVLQLLLSQPLRLPRWVDALSPFTHLARLPVEPFDATPAVVQLVLAAALVALGLWGYSRRDVAAG
jgi:ABC-2 type transport system permease protein